MPPAVALALIAAGMLAAAEPERLTRDGRNKRDPVVVDAGRSIVYTVQGDLPKLVLSRLVLAGGRITRVFPEANLPELKAVYSADRQTIAWLRITGNDRVSLLVKPRDAESPYMVKTKKTVAWSPSLTPDGKGVIFNLAGQLVVHSIPPGTVRTLAKSAGRNDWPAVSPDGRRVAFGSSRHGNFEIYTVRIDGEDLRRLTHRKGIDMRPAWSADGRRIAFTSVLEGNYEICVMNADGSGLVNLSNHPERDDYPTWHPDGRVLWVGEREGRQDLYLGRVVSPRPQGGQEPEIRNPK